MSTTPITSITPTPLPRPTLLHFVSGSGSDVGSGSGIGSISTVTSKDLNSTKMSSGGSSATPFVVDVAQEMPQWKKDLIQRRKVNNAAAARTPTNSSAQQQQQHEQLGPSSPDLNVESTTTTTETSQQKQAKTYLYQTPAITSTTSPIVAAAVSSSSSYSTTTSSSTSAITTTTTPTKEKSEKFLIGGHYTPSPQAAAAAAVVDVVSVGQTTTTTTQSNSNNRSSKRCSIEENQADEVNDSFSASTTTTTTTAGNVPIPKQRSLLYTTAATTTPTPPANARSQSSIIYNQKITKEQQQEHNLNVNVRVKKLLREERECEREQRECESNLRSKNNNNNNSNSCEEESNNVIKTTAAMVNTSPNAMTSNRGEVESGTVTSMVITPPITTAAATTTAAAAAIATTPTGAKPNQQSHTKCETEQNSAASQVNNFNILCTSAQQQQYNQQTHTNAFSSSSSNSNISVVGISNTASGVGSIDKNCKTKISEKLQNNQFIKNQQKQQQKQNFVLPLKQQGFKYKQDTNNINTVDQQQQSPTKITANFSGTKTKMVAVQEMKKNTTQNGGHHHHHHAHHHGQHHHQLVVGGSGGSVTNVKRSQPPQAGDASVGVGVTVGSEFDTSEDLKYGPGIVSKLRCRYLSLALRDSMEQQYKQPLRRSTSLNTLLDREDDEDVIDEADVDDDDEDDVAAVELRKATDGVGVIQKRDTNAAAGGGGAGAAASMPHAGGVNSNGNSPTTATGKSIFIKKPYPIGGYVKYGTPGGAATDLNGGAAAAVLGQHQPVTPTPLLQRHSMATSTLASTTMGSVEYGNGNGTRSRHLKRGNEIMKRARSVEALLSEKSHWQSCNSYKPMATSPIGPSHHQQQQQHNVTIEDKISNARERLHSGTDALPPKRLTSIIDDTERPPPDLVKQTLKKFEASANRRPRVAQRTNGVGDVASKVANYKSIIKEQKPTVMLHTKPTTATATTMASPTKCKLPNFAASTPLPTSPGKIPAVGAVGLQRGKTNANNDMEFVATTTPTKQRTNAGVGSILERTPDVVPRQHALIAGEPNPTTYDSPMTGLSKLMGHLVLETAENAATGNNKTRQTTEMFGNETTSTMSKSFVGGNAGVAAADKQESKNINVEAGNNGDRDDGGDDDVVEKGNDDDDDDVNVEAANVGVGKHDEIKSIVNNDDDDVEYNENDNADDNDGGCVSRDVGRGSDDNDDKYIGRYMAKDVDKPLLTSTSASTSSLIAHDTLSQQQQQTVGIAAATAGSGSREFGAAAKQITKSALENIAKAGTTQEFKFTQQNLTTTSNITKITNGCETSTSSTTLPPIAPTTTRQIGVIRPLINTAAAASSTTTAAAAAAITTSTTTRQHIQQHTPPALTTREIEKNRINEMKKTHALAADGVAVTSSPLGGAVGFDTIIKQSTSSGAINEADAVATGSPIWALRKRRQGGNGSGTTGATGPMPADNSMVFNFSKSSKEVPDYIESDVVIFRRKRELPKPNESGFVLLGDLSVETSTDPDCDDFSMCPPSPCDVEFENANVVIDGKSSIRQKPKEFSFRVQFNDTLTSTFEYPSEASMVIDDSSIVVDNYSNIDDITRNFQHLILVEDQNRQQQHRQHHHVAVDEIIQLPTATSSPTPSATSANILGNLPLASLGLYTPIKGSTIDNIFQLGVTRPYNSNDAGNGNAAAAATANNGSAGGDIFNGFGEGSSIMGIGEGLIKSVDDSRSGVGVGVAVGDEESDSLHYLKPANDELNIAYSEGTQKTDLLY